MRGQFMLVDATKGTAAFIFQYFPSPVSTAGRANWNAADVTQGAKPLFYFNREPHRLTVGGLVLDNTDTGESLTPQIRELFALLEEAERGTPPLLLAAWGDRQLRCVLEELNIDEEFFDEGGEPLRARVGLSLVEVQGQRTSTSAQEIEDAEPAGATVFGPQP